MKDSVIKLINDHIKTENLNFDKHMQLNPDDKNAHVQTSHQ